MPTAHPKGCRGFSLIELMIVVSIVGLLVSMSVPMYTNFVAKTKRAEAKQFLGTVWRHQQRVFTETGQFAGTFGEMDVGLIGANRVVSPTVLQGDYYRFTLSQPNGAKSFYVSAEGNLDQDAWPDIWVITDDKN